MAIHSPTQTNLPIHPTHKAELIALLLRQDPIAAGQVKEFISPPYLTRLLALPIQHAYPISGNPFTSYPKRPFSSSPVIIDTDSL